ncbi:uncharacterized protein LOC128274311 [Anopheles cruzii]|uniref:uncharacterized protein LOC128274311 n=1 Tax=Anopheles cruzii TaxID=68878 RepID=UPI0022EC59FF|nr:uncharacterized protein LOC128274311 [Anopheles cruzii]
MRALLLLTVASFAVAYVAAERAATLQLFTDLKRTKKVLSSGNEDFVSIVQSELLLAEEEYVRSSITSESGILEQLTTSDALTSGPLCVAFVKQKAEIMMNLAGISYASCLKRVDDELFQELSDATNGAISREQYDQANVLNAFRGENIFVDPANIRSKLNDRMRNTYKLPVSLSSEAIADIRKELSKVKDDFVECMKSARAGLESTLSTTEQQLKLVCADKRN